MCVSRPGDHGLRKSDSLLLPQTAAEPYREDGDVTSRAGWSGISRAARRNLSFGVTLVMKVVLFLSSSLSLSLNSWLLQTNVSFMSPQTKFSLKTRTGSVEVLVFLLNLLLPGTTALWQQVGDQPVRQDSVLTMLIHC